MSALISRLKELNNIPKTLVGCDEANAYVQGEGNQGEYLLSKSIVNELHNMEC